MSLGDGGRGYLFFASGIPNGNGPDIAIFENAMDMEAVSSSLSWLCRSICDGIEYHRFLANRLPKPMARSTVLEALWPTMFKALQVSIPANRDTFDLEEIDALNPMDTVYYVRCIDVIGSLDSTLGVTIARKSYQ